MCTAADTGDRHRMKLLSGAEGGAPSDAKLICPVEAKHITLAASVTGTPAKPAEPRKRFRQRQVDQAPSVLASARHLNSSLRKTVQSSRQSSKICWEATSAVRDGMRMLFNWLLKRTKCDCCKSSSRNAEGAESEAKKSSSTPWPDSVAIACLGFSRQTSAWLRRTKIALALMFAGVNAQGSKRTLVGPLDWGTTCGR